MSDSVGSVSVSVVPDARGWAEKLQAQIRDKVVSVRVDADTAEANAELDKTARTRTAKVKADVSQLSEGNKTLGSFVDKLGLLPALAIAGGAALVPLAGTIGGLVAAIAAPLAIAGGGATLFAFLAGLAAKDTSAQLKNVDALHKKLAGLKKGTAEYAATQKELTKAQGALTPSQVAYGKSLDGLRASFAGLLAGKSGQALLGTIASGMDLLSKTLPLTAPLLVSVGHGISTLLGDLDHAASGEGFKRFIGFLAGQAGHDIVTFGRIAGNGIKGLTGILLALDHSLGGGILHGLERLSGDFADLGSGAQHSKWLREFVDYFHRVGPQVGDTLLAVGRALGHIAAALAPLGPVVLSGLTHAANALSSIPIPVLTALAGATAGLVLFNKAGGFKATGFALNKLTSGQGLAGGLIGAAKVVPVFVTNWGGKLPSGEPIPFPGKGGDGTSLADRAGSLAKDTAKLPFAAAAGVGAQIFKLAAGDIDIFKRASQTPNPYDPNALKASRIGGAQGLALQGGGSLNIDFDKLSSQLDTVGAKSKYLERIRYDLAHIASGSNPSDPSGPLAKAGGALHDLSEAAKIAGNGVGSLKQRQRDLGELLLGPLGAGAVEQLNRRLDGLPNNKHIDISVNTTDAIRSLERLQAYRIQNKYFTVYQRSQAADRTVGPGGGIGVTPHTGQPDPPHSGSSHGATRTPVHVHLDDSGRHTLTGFMEGTADRVYHANRGYEDQAAGR